MRGLTNRQAEVLSVIRQSIEEHGYAPSLREICKATGIGSTNGANDHIQALVRKGAITREPETARSIRVVGDPAPKPVQRVEPASPPYAGPWTLSSPVHASFGDERLYVSGGSLIYVRDGGRGQVSMRFELPIDLVRRLAFRKGSNEQGPPAIKSEAR